MELKLSYVPLPFCFLFCAARFLGGGHQCVLVFRGTLQSYVYAMVYLFTLWSGSMRIMALKQI